LPLNPQEARLFFLMEALCSEMGAAFEALGRPLPPWRSLELVAARWQPRRFTDVPVRDSELLPLAAAAGPAAAAAGGGGGGREGAAMQQLAKALAALGISG
jgi:hypothetical protein